MLKAQAIGNVGRDPEITVKDTYKMARFGLATNRKVKGEKLTTWVAVTVFGDKRVEFVEQYIKKGMKLFIEGDAQARAFVTKEGDAAASLDVTVSQFDGKLELMSNLEHDDEREEKPKPKPKPAARKVAASQSWDDPLDDDVPY